MRPKEKAKELVDAFYQTTPNETWIDDPLGEFIGTYTAWGQAKQCALIAVDEILNINSFEEHFTIHFYYLAVKDEIQNL